MEIFGTWLTLSISFCKMSDSDHCPLMEALPRCRRPSPVDLDRDGWAAEDPSADSAHSWPAAEEDADTVLQRCRAEATTLLDTWLSPL